MKYSNFADCRINNVTFNDCNLESSSFMNLEKIKNLCFNDCSLKECEFFKVSLNGIDLRTCNISGIRIGLEELRGVIVTSRIFICRIAAIETA